MPSGGCPLSCAADTGFTSDAELHFHARSEAVEYRNQPVQGEPSEIRVADSGEIGGGDAGAFVGLPHRQVVTVQHLDDFGGQNGSELLRIGA